MSWTTGALSSIIRRRGLEVFLDAAYVRALDGPLPVFQEVQRLGKLTRVTIKLRDVVRAAYRKHKAASKVASSKRCGTKEENSVAQQGQTKSR